MLTISGDTWIYDNDEVIQKNKPVANANMHDEKLKPRREFIPFSIFEMLSGLVADVESVKLPSLTSCASDGRFTLASIIANAST